jgi:hypothetical protein
MSPEAKFEVASFDVNVNAIDVSVEVEPLLTVPDVIVMVGAVVSAGGIVAEVTCDA